MSSGLPSEEVAEDYKSSLEDLHDSARLAINNLTIIAKENVEHAAAIARVLETHIRTTPPNRKLPALYLLDSIVKNVGTPYTLFFGSNLYATFMNAYSLVNPFIRQKLDEMLGTWKQPNAGSLDTKPVFPPEITQPIEQALVKARAAAAEQHRQQQMKAQQEAFNKNQQMQMANQWRNTPTPTQMGGQFMPPQQQYSSQSYYSQTPDPMQFSQFQPPIAVSQDPIHQGQIPSASVMPAKSHYTPPINLTALHKDIEELIWIFKSRAISEPMNIEHQERLQALLALQNILRQQYHPPEQLQLVQTQVTALRSISAAMPPPNASHPHIAPTMNHEAQRTEPMSSVGSIPSNIQALLASGSIADIVAKAQNRPSTPSHPPPIVAAPEVKHSHSSSATSATDTAALLASLQARGLLGSIPATNSSASSAIISNIAESFAAANPLNDVQLTSQSLKISRPKLYASLQESRPNQCTTCGLRFLATEDGREKKRRHYDWHFKTNQRMSEASRRAQNRSWYLDELEWIRYRDDSEGNPIDSTDTLGPDGKPVNDAATDPKLKYVAVPSDSTLANLPCPICQEKFVASFNSEAADWVWMDAIKIGSRIYHASCHADMKKNGSREATPARTATPDSVLGKRKANTLL